MSHYTVRALSPSTWDAYAGLVERHNGVWGGCWCMGFHRDGFAASVADNRRNKETRVNDGRAMAALVFDGDTAVGWCQFGRSDELTRIKHRKQYDAQGHAAPDWRITCFFTDKDYRRAGISDVALRGAVELIAERGGGTIESYPEELAGQKTSGSFLFNSTLSVFEKNGFQRVDRLGKYRWVVRRTV